MIEFFSNRVTQAHRLMARENVPEAITLFKSLLSLISDVKERREVLSEIDYGLLIVGDDDEADALDKSAVQFRAFRREVSRLCAR